MTGRDAAKRALAASRTASAWAKRDGLEEFLAVLDGLGFEVAPKAGATRPDAGGGTAFGESGASDG